MTTGFGLTRFESAVRYLDESKRVEEADVVMVRATARQFRQDALEDRFGYSVDAFLAEAREEYPSRVDEFRALLLGDDDDE